jgi:CRP-like cAMP-binding protein
MVEGRRPPATNRLLAALPDRERHRCLGRCETLELTSGNVIAKPGKRIRAVYFPTGSAIGLRAPHGARAELGVALVGAEGMVGMSLILGVSVSPLMASVQGSGPALRMDATSFRHELERSQTMRRTLNRYVHVAMEQLVRSVVCSQFHRVEARLARWLLMMQDRMFSNELHATHDFLAEVLGVRRVGVTVAATSLQNRGLIGYRRGDITIFDRGGLRAASCGCYEGDSSDYERTVGRRRQLA